MLGLPESWNSHDVTPIAFDFTHDELVDVILFSNGDRNGINASQIQFYENKGAGLFIDVTDAWLKDYPVYSGIPYDPIFIDLNGDGFEDIYLNTPMYDGGPQNAAVLLTDAYGVYTDSFRYELSLLALCYIHANFEVTNKLSPVLRHDVISYYHMYHRKYFPFTRE